MKREYDIEVETCFGDICVEHYTSIDYPGVWIDLVRPDGKVIQLAVVESNRIHGEPVLHVLAWDGDHEDFVSETVVNPDGEWAYE